MPDSTDSDLEPLLSALAAIERRELGLLTWGVVDASFIPEEIERIVSDALDGGNPADVVAELQRRCLLVETPAGTLRSRMAETVRLLATLRQTFRGREWWEGAPLVRDYRLLHRPRSRPRRDIPVANLLSRLAAQSQGRPTLTESGRAVAQQLLPTFVSGFQEEAAVKILTALRAGQDNGVMVTAGTGSGKTLAFYLPAFSWIAEDIAKAPRNNVRCIALYPRNELLKDQFAYVVSQARKLHLAGSVVRPIVIGTWFGATPSSAGAVIYGRAQGWEPVKKGNKVTGWHCPFADCPDCRRPMIWRERHASAGRERLECDTCAYTLDEDVINLTREKASKRPADIILTSTESANRQLSSPDRHTALGISSPRLRLVLLDEAHVYEGTTGAQNAYLLRRLRHVVGHPLTWVGLSATLVSADRYLEQLAGLSAGSVTTVQPRVADMEDSGAEYQVALRHDSSWRTGPLSTTIQAAMLAERCLDYPSGPASYVDTPSSGGLFGSRTFAFTDKLDVTNRLYWNLLDAEGWRYPGRPVPGHVPLTLAHLRAERQDRRPPRQREQSDDREPVGQWWWLPERLGWNVEGDRQLNIGRTSSQDSGVSDDAHVIVATATLEVGYDDDRVGAVVQHKAPHDAAQFLQRRGRAGRDPLMRPWTVVVLSDWGRDRRSWQLYEDLFDPELQPRNLPLGNRHVLRMQAVYALMDWIGDEIQTARGQQSVWADLAAPAEMTTRNDQERASRRERQKAIAHRLDEVLTGGLARMRLRAYLRKSLSLGPDSDDYVQATLDALLWEPPRSLLLTVIPTIRRRLESEWAGEEPDNEDAQVQTRTPLREFVAGNLFDDLLVPEVQVIAGGRVPGQRDEHQLPALRTLRELMPGNVTRHFGIRSDDRRHWVAPAEPLHESPSQVVDVVSTYAATLLTHFPDPTDPAREVYLYRPLRVTLDSPPDSVRDATRSDPQWGVSLDGLGSGQHVQLANNRLSDLFTAGMFHTHADGDGVRVRRYAMGAKGALFRDGDPTAFEFSFSSAEVPPRGVAALGTEIDVDGIVIDIRLPGQFSAPTREERLARLRWLITDDSGLPDELSSFERTSIALALQFVLADVPDAEPGRTVSNLSDTALTDCLVDALHCLGAVRQASGGHRTDGLTTADWAGDEDVLLAVRRAARATAGDRDPAWRQWVRGRFAASIGAIVIEAISSACPAVDTSDLALDFEPGLGESTMRVWITEMSPGGTGQVESVRAALTREPGRFADLLETAVDVGDVEELDPVLRSFLEAVQVDPGLSHATANLRDSWHLGHQATEQALAHLREIVATAGIEISKLGWSVIGTRLFGPGAASDLPSTVTAWVQSWDDAEEHANIALDPLVVGALIAAREDVSEVLNLPDDASAQRQARAVANIFWPRGETAWQDGADAAVTFGPQPQPDISLVRSVLGPTPQPLEVSNWDAETRELVHSTLRNDARIVIRVPSARPDLARRIVLDTQEEPVDLERLLAYPDVTGITRTASHVDIALVLREVAT